MIFPWQKAQWHQLCRLKQANRLPHAILLTGMGGLGKALFADNFSRSLLCQQNCENIDENIQRCHSCRLIAGRTHPSVMWIQPEKAGQGIKIDQIRSVTDFVNQSALQGTYRIVIINPADRMNMNAANALLKTLEEPSDSTLLILISEQGKRLPATLISRCQQLNFKRPNTQLAIAWLEQQMLPHKEIDFRLLLNVVNGAPLAVLRMVEESTFSVRHDLYQTLFALQNPPQKPIQDAANMQSCDLLLILDFILSWVMDLLRLQLGGEVGQVINQDYAPQLTNLSQQRSLQQNVQLMDYLQQLRMQIVSGINLNKQLLIENILIRWCTPEAKVDYVTC